MRGIGKRLRAAAALAGLMPALIAQANAQGVTCQAENLNGSKGTTYIGVFGVTDGKLSLNAAATRITLSPVTSTVSSGRMSSHTGTPRLDIDFGENAALDRVLFVDEGIGFAIAPTRIGLIATAGGTEIVRGSEAFTGTAIPQLSRSWTAQEFGALRDLKIVLTHDDVPFATYLFKLSPTAIAARQASLRQAGSKAFNGTAFDSAAQYGGRADKYCERQAAPASDPGCYLTTAAVDMVGLPDDCWELRQLRAFRDRTVAAGGDRAALVREYYAFAPQVVTAIGQRSDARAEWLRTYFATILPAAIAARLGWDGAAYGIYARSTRRLRALARA